MIEAAVIQYILLMAFVFPDDSVMKMYSKDTFNSQAECQVKGEEVKREALKSLKADGFSDPYVVIACPPADANPI